MKKQKIGDICRIDDQDRAAADPLTLNFLESQASLGDSRLQRRLLKELIGKYVALEKRVTDLLRNTLPAPVAEEIKYQGHYAPRPFDCTILFLDIAGFTGLAERMTGEALIDLIDELFQGFDDLIARCRGTKIKTIGDAYMVAGGINTENADYPAAIADLALSMQAVLQRDFAVNSAHLQMRMGIGTGPVVAGVVGKKKFIYDLWGDTVNLASRITGEGAPGMIHCDTATYQRLSDRFAFSAPQTLHLKGKGDVVVYRLIGRETGVA